MEYTVGVCDTSVKLCSLIENRLPPGQKLSGQIRIAKDLGNYVLMELESKEQMFLLADILADIIIENLQVRFIMKEIAAGYCFVAEKDQCEILINTIKKLWYQSAGKQDLEQVKKDVSSRVLLCLFESEEKIVLLDGVMRFRMQDCLAVWKKAVEDSVNEYLIKSEKKEFVKLLRYFVSMRDPMIEYVVVRLEAGEYKIFDAQNIRVTVPYEQEEEPGASKEDLLLSCLINLSPEAIDISHIPDENLKSLLKDIFVGRTRQ